MRWGGKNGVWANLEPALGDEINGGSFDMGSRGGGAGVYIMITISILVMLRVAGVGLDVVEGWACGRQDGEEKKDTHTFFSQSHMALTDKSWEIAHSSGPKNQLCGNSAGYSQDCCWGGSLNTQL